MIVRFNFLSQTLMQQTNVTMILPSWTLFDDAKGKAKSYVPKTKFQTLYLFHSGTGDDSDYLNFSNIVRYADENKIAVIMPCGYNSSYINQADDVLPWPARYWDYIFDELPRVCAAMFPISTKREDTFIGGVPWLPPSGRYTVVTKAFTERYEKWCKRKDYHFSAGKAACLYAASCGHFTTLPKNDNTKLLITSAAAELTAAAKILATIRAEVIRLAKLLPEYETVIAMYGVGDITGAQLMAEIGDVRRFPNRSSLTAFAGIDPEVNQSGKQKSKSNATTKRGSTHLRKTLYQIICTYLKRSPTDEPVYQFLDKKRAEGKPYFVYMTAASNKFLRIYYARVKEQLNKLNSEL
jgi:hypothetical protein